MNSVNVRFIKSPIGNLLYWNIVRYSFYSFYFGCENLDFVKRVIRLENRKYSLMTSSPCTLFNIYWESVKLLRSERKIFEKYLDQNKRIGTG